jgi:hypothetical protein
MTLYLCGTAALDVMRYLRSTNGGLIPGEKALPRKLGGAVHGEAQLKALPDDALRLLEHVDGKVEALVPSHQMVTKTSRLQTHVWSHPIVSGSFVNLHNGIYLSSPQFLFLQLAPTLSEVELAMLGMELCGFYSLWRMPLLFRSRDEKEKGGATYNLAPALNARTLAAYIERMAGERGAVKARNAMRYVMDNAASPMESAVYLLLCLPRRVGGRGLPAPEFNVSVHVSTSPTHEKRYPDLYWRFAGLDVEYQSDFAHRGEWSRLSDARRAIEIEAEDISVLPLTNAQLMDVDGFNAFAVSVRRKLGVRSRPLAPDWFAKYLELRRAVLHPA